MGWTERMNHEGAAEYQAALESSADAVRDALRAYAKWHAHAWQQSLEEWKSSTDTAPPGGPEWFAGYEAGVLSTIDSVEFFFGEMGP
jgi:hypothetical protein